MRNNKTEKEYQDYKKYLSLLKDDQKDIKKIKI